jgi:hypothetical protein
MKNSTEFTSKTVFAAPGPAKYGLQTLVGFQGHEFNSRKNRQPQWSLGEKVKGGDESRFGPGPAYLKIEKVTRFGKVSEPTPSLHQKTKDPSRNWEKSPTKFNQIFFSPFTDHSSSPGPTYNPTDPSLYRFRYEPKFSMRTKLKDLVGEKGPGPDQKPTDLDVYKTRSPRYPLGVKTKELEKDKFPAPNRYNSSTSKAKTMVKHPAYSMGTKTGALAKGKTPSPADYNINRHNPFRQMPAFTMRTKHSQFVHVPILPMDNC